MYAVFITGGKQYKAQQGDQLKIELLNAEQGDKVEFNKILLIRNEDELKIGKPYLDDASITAEILNHGRHKKIKVIKFKRRKHHMKHMGHRQYFTEIKITDIKLKTSKNKSKNCKSDSGEQQEG